LSFEHVLKVLSGVQPSSQATATGKTTRRQASGGRCVDLTGWGVPPAYFRYGAGGLPCRNLYGFPTLPLKH